LVDGAVRGLVEQGGVPAACAEALVRAARTIAALERDK